jgi:tetratricopeptide (TPR) repeat protein
LDLASLLVSKIAGTAIDKFIRRLVATNDACAEAIGRTERNTERMLLAPLLEAITHLDLGDYAKAQERLIAAEAVDPLAAFPKLLLGVVLLKRGLKEAGQRRLRQSLELNPYNLPFHEWPVLTDTRESVRTRVLDRSLRFPGEISKTSVRREGWRATLPKLVWFRGPVPAASIQEALLTELPEGDAVVIIRWLVGHESPRSLISGVHLPSGDVLWTLEPSDCESLALATPTVVITKFPTKKGDRFRFRGTVDPAAVEADMSTAYFQSMFCPQWPQLLMSNRYTVSRADFQTDRRTVADQALRLPPPWGRHDLRRLRPIRIASEAFGIGGDTVMRTFSEERLLHAVSRPDLPVVAIRNTYRVAQRPLRPPLTDVFCDASLEWSGQRTTN